MNPLWLRLRAPFAAFRWMQAGVWRGTCPTIPFSAAWGLVLNLAGVETRSSEVGTTTLVRGDAPILQLAIGEIARPERAVLYQQLHSYPVGIASAGLRDRARGAKYHIAPVKRELLVGFDVVVGVRTTEPALAGTIAAGLEGSLAGSRYGLPFAGDNNLLFDRIDLLQDVMAARWYLPIDAGRGPVPRNCRLTIGIDRHDSSRTTTGLFGPTADALPAPPEASWIWTPRAPS